MTVSVIIPTYNRADYIEECVNSVLNQTFKDIEIIVVDDGSTDKTYELLKDKPITYLYQEHKNTASAMNRGIVMSRGEWIKPLGSDDYMKEDCIDLFMLLVKEKMMIYYADYDILKPHKITKFICPEYPINEQYCNLRESFYGGNAFLNRELFTEYGLYDETLPYAEDYDFYLKCVLDGVPMKHLSFNSMIFRIHQGQNTKKYGNSLDEQIRQKYPSC
jgi:teichuronic acid biosynthesis glycosyltransferase TuaG